MSRLAAARRRTVARVCAVGAGLVLLSGCGTDVAGPVAAAEAPAPATTVASVGSPTTVEAPPTSIAPTTVAPTTVVPTTVAPTTVAPTTVAPTTVAPTTTIDQISPYLSAFCPTTPHAVAVDRDRQRAWLCEDGRAVYEFPFTGAVTQPDPGTYPVYAKDLQAYSTLSGERSDMTHFVAFTYGKFQGARIAFHSVPVRRDGSFLQPLESVGDVSMRGQSAGCLRVLPDDAVRVWDWLAIGDEVRVIN
jgi:hypothetical protein